MASGFFLFRSSVHSFTSPREQHWGRDIKELFESSKITDPLNVSGDFLLPLSYPKETIEDNLEFCDNIDELPVYLFITKSGEITALSHNLPKIITKISLENTEINSVCNFFPSNTFLVSSKSRNSVLAGFFDFNSSGNSNYFQFTEIPGIDRPELICPIDNNSFLVATSTSHLYRLDISEFLKKPSSTPYKQIFSLGSTQSKPIELSYCDGYVALSSESGLLIGKFQEPGFVDETIPETEFEPFMLFFPKLPKVHHLTFVPMNEMVTFLFYLSENGDIVAYFRINDNSHLAQQKGRKTKQIIISIEEEPIRIYSATSIKTNVISDMFCTSYSSNSSSKIKTVIFSGDKEIFSFTPSLLLTSSSMIFTKIKLPNQNKEASICNSIIKLQKTSQPHIFAALFQDGTVCICRHPPLEPLEKGKTYGEIQTEVLYNFHKARPILSCTANELSFLTFDENHVAILWESFPDWWKAPSYFRMFEDQSDDSEEEDIE